MPSTSKSRRAPYLSASAREENIPHIKYHCNVAPAVVNLAAYYMAEAFSPADREVLRSYAAFLTRVEKAMEELRKRLSKKLGLVHASEVRSGRGYVYFCSIRSNAELCPGLRYGEDFILKPVLWIATRAQLEAVGYARDEEFPDYYVKEGELSEDFFKKSFEEQLQELESFFAGELRRLRLLGIIDEFSSTAMG